MRKEILIGLLVLGVLILSGCAQQQVNYECRCHEDCGEGKFCTGGGGGGNCENIITNNGCTSNAQCGSGQFCNKDWVCQNNIMDIC